MRVDEFANCKALSLLRNLCSLHFQKYSLELEVNVLRINLYECMNDNVFKNLDC